MNKPPVLLPGGLFFIKRGIGSDQNPANAGGGAISDLRTAVSVVSGEVIVSLIGRRSVVVAAAV